MGKLVTIDQTEVQDKRVIVRVDWNVTLGKTLEIVDDTRVSKTFATINWLLEHGVRQIILISHLGKAEEKRSLSPVVSYAQKLLGQEIKLVAEFGVVPDTQLRLVCLENIRLFEGEDSNDPVFARQLAQLGDIYVNEAFGESHRESASMVGVPRLLPHYAGLWLSQEVETILKVRDNPERPLVVVMGGAKVEDKIKLLEVLSQRAETILLGGKLANEYVTRGIKLGGRAEIVVPREGSNILDIGQETQQIFAKVIRGAGTVIWNGPMGKVEEPSYRLGTQAVYEAMIQNERAYTVVGGGDTLAAISSNKQAERIDHISTGGGAMLKLLEAGTLPGIEVLES